MSHLASAERFYELQRKGHELERGRDLCVWWGCSVLNVQVTGGRGLPSLYPLLRSEQ